ncbi:hypothetical protein SAMN05421855_102819 [Ulvibacter litoralis]|uniref:Uncharacterized protein n=2 Tax=Ulvibacter litoralis TaxID=227084 RepID=A0A1G7FWB1_9FLAO|nr:hypothetical protein SAMN05421855_102819 [Ulvibacter litoralis]
MITSNRNKRIIFTMKNFNTLKKHFFLLAVLCSLGATSQVVIGDTTIDNGAIFQLKSDNKGLLIPNVALTSRYDVTTISSSLVEGLWVYNTASAGSGLNRVSPGFYFWDSSKWVRIYNDGYTVQFEQTSTVRSANTTTTYTIPGLDQSIVAPYTGTYEIHVTGYIAAPDRSNSSRESMVHGSYMLEIDNVKVGESNVTSNTKNAYNTGFQALGRQTTIVHYVDLTEGTTYNFKVRARLWQQENINPYSLNVSSLCGGPSTGYAFWGICSGPYNGNDGLTENAQDAYLTITLLTQY